MKLEDQVVSLELAKKLKELGVRQDGHFDWYEHEGIPYVADFANRYIDPLSGHHEKYCSAFTVAELGEMLPKKLKSEEWGSLELVYKHDLLAYGMYQFECTFHEVWIELGDTEADARAAMLIYLIENKLVDPISSNES